MKECIWESLGSKTLSNGTIKSQVFQDKNSQGNRIGIGCITTSNTIQIRCYIDQELRAPFHQALIKAKCPYVFVETHFYLSFTEQKKGRVPIFFGVLSQYLSIQSIKKEIFDFFSIKAIEDKIIFLNDLRELIKAGELSKAREKVDAVDDEYILFEYAALLEEMDSLRKEGEGSYLPTALDIYHDIEEDNPRSSEAKEACLRILMIYETVNKLSPEEKDSILENKIRLMLRINNPEAQTVLDKHFSQWSGHAFSSEFISDITINEGTIIRLGKELQRLNKINQNLSQQNNKLRAKLKKIEPLKERSKLDFFIQPDTSQLLPFKIEANIEAKAEEETCPSGKPV